MSDLVLLLLLLVLLVCLVVTIGGFLVYSGLLSEVNVKTGPPPIRNVTIAYKFREGSYKDCGAAFTETCSIGPKLSTIAMFYDDPKQVRAPPLALAVDPNLTPCHSGTLFYDKLFKDMRGFSGSKVTTEARYKASNRRSCGAAFSGTYEKVPSSVCLSAKQSKTVFICFHTGKSETLADLLYVHFSRGQCRRLFRTPSLSRAVEDCFTLHSRPTFAVFTQQTDLQRG